MHQPRASPRLPLIACLFASSAALAQVPQNPSAPTVIANSCDGALLTRAAAIPTEESWYWQGTTCGTSTILGSAPTFTATTIGTYFLRARNNTSGSWSPGCSSVFVPAPSGQWVAPFPAVRSNTPTAYDSRRGRIVMFGGSSADHFDDTWEWDGANWTLIPLPFGAPKPSGRSSHVMAYDSARGVTVLYGGYNGSYLSDTWEWNGATWTLRTTTGPGPRTYSSLAYDSARARTVLFGGFSGSAFPTSTWEWDGSNWSQRASTGPQARYECAMAYDSFRQRTVLFGGHFNNAFSDTWEWDGDTWTRRSFGGPSARYAHAMAYDSLRRKTVLLGGLPVDGGSVWEWDGASWTEVVVLNQGIQISNHAMAYDQARRRTVCIGGSAAGYIIEWSGESWTSSTQSPMSKRESHWNTYDPTRQRVALTGGYYTGSGSNFYYQYYGDSWEWDGAAWVSRPGFDNSRADHSVVFDTARSKMVLWGGSSRNGTDPAFGYPPTVSEWDDSGNTLLFPSSPQGRDSYGAVYDPVRARTVIYGGQRVGSTTTQYFSDMWEWNGTAWTQRTIPTPPARSGCGMVWDPVRQRAVLFGGFNGTATLGDTWEYDGTAWTQRASAGPPPRSKMILAYDSIRQRAVLFGGDSSGVGNGLFGDTWEWDGTTWSLRQNTGSTSGSIYPRSSYGMAYDPARACMVMFGGYSYSQLADTWLLPSTSAPTVLRPPSGGERIARNPASISILAGGATPFTYRWRHNNAELQDGPTGRGSTIYGAASPALTISDARPDDAGLFDCIVTNACGTAISPAATLTIFCRGDFDRSGTVDTQDIFAFINAWFARDPRADANGSGTVTVADIFDYLRDWFDPC